MALKSIKDYVREEYISDNFTVCPPEVPNERWHWSPEAYVKEGEQACQISKILQSKPIQEKLLNITTDVVCVANLVGWNSLVFYIKLPQEIIDVVNAMPETYYNFRGTIKPSNNLEHFAEGEYIRLGICSDTSCKKQAIANNLDAEFGIFDKEKALKKAAARFVEQYDFSDVKYSDREAIQKIGDMLFDYIARSEIFDKIKELLFLASDLWYKHLEEVERQKQEKIAKEKAEKEAKIQSYIDWINSGNPVCFRYGFAYRGAKANPIEASKAINMVINNEPFEYNWETIDGEKTLVLQDYSENDMW